MGFPCFSAIARSVMISATFFFFVPNRLVCFSAIARSVMISAPSLVVLVVLFIPCFSAIARSVMISAWRMRRRKNPRLRVSVL